MRPLNPSKREQATWLVCLAILFGALFLLCWLFPLIGDDWYREALGITLHSPLDLVRPLINEWATTNARVLGNILAYTAGSRPLVRELMRTLFTLALIVLLARVTGLRGWQGLLLCAAASIALPKEMFCQIYPWAAGFVNYLPPVAMLLACLALTQTVPEGRPMEESPPRGIALFLLGFGHQLFIETNTLCALWVSFLLLVWYWWERRRFSPCLLALFVGCVLGAALMFASPSYGLIGSEGGAYQLGAGGTLSGLLATAKENFREVARFYIIKCPVLYWSLTILTLLLWGQARRRPVDHAIAAALVLGCLGLAYGRFKPVAVAAVWGLACTAALWRWTGRRPVRAKALFLWLTAPVAAGPLLFVNPIGPRCLFVSYVLLLGVAGVLLQTLELDRLPAWVRSLVPAGAALAVFGFYLSIFVPFHQLELLRTQILEEAIEYGAGSVCLPAYEHDGYLWDADSDYKMELFYYCRSPGDLKISFAPMDELAPEGLPADFRGVFYFEPSASGQEVQP